MSKSKEIQVNKGYIMIIFAMLNILIMDKYGIEARSFIGVILGAGLFSCGLWRVIRPQDWIDNNKGK